MSALPMMEENRNWWRQYASELLEESQMKNDDIKKLENDVYMLEQLVDELRKDAQGYKASSERWKQMSEDIGKAAEKQELIDEQLHIDLEHAMAQNKALVAHTLEIDDAIMKERERAYRENKAFQVEQAKEIENLESELRRATDNGLQVQVEKMQEMVDVLWDDRCGYDGRVG